MEGDESPAPGTMADASNSAEAHLTQAFAQESAPAAPAQEAPATAAVAPQSVASEAVSDYEFDYNGSRHKLSRGEADYLLRFGLDAYQRAMNQQKSQAPQQAQQAQQAPTQNTQPQTDALMGRIDKLEQQLSNAHNERQVEKITAQLQAAVSKVALYSELGKPEHQELFKTLTMVEQYSNPNFSAESAAESAGKKLSALLRDKQSAYVQSKVEQAGKRVESGGSGAATPQGPMGAKDLHNGNVLKSAMNRLKNLVHNT